MSPGEERQRWWGMAGKCWALPSPGVHLPRTLLSLLGVLGERSLKGKKYNELHTMQIRRPEVPKLLHFPPPTIEAAGSH